VHRSHPFRQPPPEFYPASVSLGFIDGVTTTIAVKKPLDDIGKRDRWEKFCETARDAVTR
jgi:hypothetical protein